jgi:hypothetical protein
MNPHPCLDNRKAVNAFPFTAFLRLFVWNCGLLSGIASSAFNPAKSC